MTSDSWPFFKKHAYNVIITRNSGGLNMHGFGGFSALLMLVICLVLVLFIFAIRLLFWLLVIALVVCLIVYIVRTVKKKKNGQ